VPAHRAQPLAQVVDAHAPATAAHRLLCRCEPDAIRRHAGATTSGPPQPEENIMKRTSTSKLSNQTNATPAIKPLPLMTLKTQVQGGGGFGRPIMVTCFCQPA
jgi:hypothetical protein